MNRIEEIVGYAQNSIPNGTLIESDKETKILKVRLKSAPFEIKVLLIVLWFCLTYIIVPLIDKEVGISFRSYHYLFADNKDTTSYAVMFFYGFVFIFVIPALFIPIFILLSRLFHIKVVLSNSLMEVLSFGRKRWEFKNYDSIHFRNKPIPLKERLLKKSKLQERNILIVEKGLNQNEADWLNHLLQEVMKYKDHKD